MAGTSARCSARYAADAITFSLGWPVPRSRSAAADMNGSAVVAVQLAELVLDPLVAHDDPSPAAEVAAGRCLLGEVDAVEQQLVVDRALEVEPPADRACRRQHLVDRRGHRCPSQPPSSSHDARTVGRVSSIMQLVSSTLGT